MLRPGVEALDESCGKGNKACYIVPQFSSYTISDYYCSQYFVRLHITASGYTMKENMYCAPQKAQRYYYLLDAAEECTRDSDCSMFYQEGKGHYLLCTSRAFRKESTIRSVLYIKGK